MDVFRIENGILKSYAGPGGDVTVPAGVTAVGRAAFHGCGTLRSVILPEGLVSLGGSAFAECASLQSVAFPESLGEIGSWAFCGCTALKSVSLPPRLRRLGARTFWRCGALRSVTLPEGLESIGAEAFRGCASLGALELPASLRALGERAFQGCAALGSADLPEGVETVPREAFADGASLARVSLPESLKTVESGAFRRCAALRELRFPAGTERVTPSALEGCTALERIDLLSGADPAFLPEGVAAAAPAVSLRDARRKTELTFGYALACREGTIYPAARIAEYEEYMRAQSALLAPLSLEGHPGLLEALLDSRAIPPEDVDALVALCRRVEPRTALLDYKGRLLSSGTEGEDLDLDLTFDLEPLSETAAEKLWELRPAPDGVELTRYIGAEKEIYVPERIGPRRVTGLGEYAFSPEQPGLRAVERAVREEIAGVCLPAGVRRIGENAFRGCRSLNALLLPEDPESVGSGAFAGTPWWESLPEGGVYFGAIFYRYRGNMPPDLALSVREGTVRIAPAALRDRPELGEVRLPEGAESVGAMAFYNDTGLSRIALPASLREIGDYAFYGCEALEEIAFPAALRRLGQRAFRGCLRLRSVALPGGLREIQSESFYRCESLRTAELGPGAERLGDRAFYGCRALERLTLPGSLTSIGERALDGCPRLTLRAPRGSFALDYAEKHGLACEALEE